MLSSSSLISSCTRRSPQLQVFSDAGAVGYRTGLSKPRSHVHSGRDSPRSYQPASQSGDYDRDTNVMSNRNFRNQPSSQWRVPECWPNPDVDVWSQLSSTHTTFARHDSYYPLPLSLINRFIALFPSSPSSPRLKSCCRCHADRPPSPADATNHKCALPRAVKPMSCTSCTTPRQLATAATPTQA